MERITLTEDPHSETSLMYEYVLFMIEQGRCPMAAARRARSLDVLMIVTERPVHTEN